MMTPWERARIWHDEHISTETFEESFGWHLSCGYVWSTPEVFLLAREVHWDADREEIAINEDLERNAWFVTLAASVGSANPVREFLRIAPHKRPWCLWCRRGEMRVRAFEWDKLSKKVRL